MLDEAKIVAAIGDVELKATAEIRVHVEKRCPVDVMDHAVEVFANLNITKPGIETERSFI